MGDTTWLVFVHSNWNFHPVVGAPIDDLKQQYPSSIGLFVGVCIPVMIPPVPGPDLAPSPPSCAPLAVVPQGGAGLVKLTGVSPRRRIYAAVRACRSERPPKSWSHRTRSSESYGASAFGYNWASSGSCSSEVSDCSLHAAITLDSREESGTGFMQQNLSDTYQPRSKAYRSRALQATNTSV